jgi:hypothetical protein
VNPSLIAYRVLQPRPSQALPAIATSPLLGEASFRVHAEVRMPATRTDLFCWSQPHSLGVEPSPLERERSGAVLV